MAHIDAKPEWMAFANKAINPWGSGDFTLQHVVAIALEDAYNMGKAGTPPPEWVPPVRAELGGLYDFASHLKKKPKPIEAPPPPASKVMRRTRGGSPELEAAFDVLIPEEHVPTVLRRSRPAPPPPPALSARQIALQAALQAALAPPAPPPPKLMRRTR